jgi:ATP-dependent DNA helicase MPH1
MDEEDYDDIADEDLIEALSQSSQSLPPLRHSPDSHSNKRRRLNRETADEDGSDISVQPAGGEDEENERSKKKKYRIHVGADVIPAAKIWGATQAEGYPDSSPSRIRGPIYKKPRPEPPPNSTKTTVNIRRLPQQQSLFDSFQRRPKSPPQHIDVSRELADLPSDAFSSPESNHGPILIGSSPPRQSQSQSQFVRQRLAAPQNGLKQTTLFGSHAAPEAVSASQARKVHNFIVDLPPEAPTHHKLNTEALKTWVYPTNLGDTRDYQFSIVRNGLFNNLLVALPTGLGKTFIAATIMLNYFRWTKDAQIVFVAPTKPLVAQQAEACFGIVGIPKSQTTMLTGEQQPALRAEEWATKRVFFMTPQTFENDLSSGIADPKKIVLLVVDEAHRATGNYSYVKVVSFLRRFNKSFRILALTATPGSSVEAVQEVIDGLEISKVEIRSEVSIDIAQYVHRRDIDQIVLDPSDEIVKIKELYSNALKSLVNQLCSQNGYYNKDPMSITTFGLILARKQWFASGAAKAASHGLKGMMNGLFAILASCAHGIKLLDFHGIAPFYSSVKDFRDSAADGQGGGSKYKKQILEHPDFQKMITLMQMWINMEDFVGHPKLTCLCETILNHFLDAGQGRLGEDMPPSATRVIVFAEYRDSAEDICRVLNKHGPMIRASVFVGQADSKRSEGMNQAKQQETINDFKAGKINVIVATSIGEEGLDIGQVDLIVCYDASGSPIRMLQRMGRTGRKRAGHIVLLLMRGKEENNFAKAKDNYEQMQKMISSGQRFNFRHDLSVRIIPRDIIPTVDMRMIEIPVENIQDNSLPVPTRRAKKGAKKPPKKFHMPDGVQTGFQKASKLNGGGATRESPESDLVVVAKKKRVESIPESSLAQIINVSTVLLDQDDTLELERRYQNIAGNDFEEVGMPDMAAQPEAQRKLGPARKVPHGKYTKRCVKLFKTLFESQNPDDRYHKPYGDTSPSRESWYVETAIAEKVVTRKATPKARKVTAPRAKQIPKPPKVKPTKARSASKAKKPKARLFAMMDPGSDMEATPGGTAAGEISGDDTEGEGDDCDDTEMPSQDSEMPSSMLDFVVNDASSTMGVRRSSLTRSSSPPSTRPSRKQIPLDSLFCTQNSDHDEHDDSASDTSTVRGDVREAVPGSTVQVPSSDTEDTPQVKAKRKRKPIFEDDSDE